LEFEAGPLVLPEDEFWDVFTKDYNGEGMFDAPPGLTLKGSWPLKEPKESVWPWRSQIFAAEFGDPFIQHSYKEGGNSLNAFFKLQGILAEAVGFAKSELNLEFLSQAGIPFISTEANPVDATKLNAILDVMNSCFEFSQKISSMCVVVFFLAVPVSFLVPSVLR
jgi:hypothetical protein